jgi:hypothetical protein
MTRNGSSPRPLIGSRAPSYRHAARWRRASPDSGKRDRKRVALHGISFTKALHAGVKMAFGTDDTTPSGDRSPVLRDEHVGAVVRARMARV